MPDFRRYTPSHDGCGSARPGLQRQERQVRERSRAGLEGTAAAGGDANNFGLYSGTTLLATSVNAGAVGSYPQTAVTADIGSTPTTVAIKNIGAGTTGSVYNASLTATPLMTGDSKGAVGWAGPGSPAAWGEGFPVTFLPGTAILLDPAGPLYAAIGAANLAAWRDGTDASGHGGLSN